MIRVLVIDDSAFARKVIRECLEVDPEITVVGTARDGLDALEKIAELTPDVATLDLVMPNLDGVGVLTGIPSDTATRFVVCSTAEEDSAAVIHALSLGAVAAIHKPTALATDRLYEVGARIIEAVRLAAGARVARPTLSVVPISVPRRTRSRMLVIGASTGGPQAITSILRQLPGDFPVPVALVVHMPVGYTEGFASRLNDVCALEVVEASDGMAFRPGRVIVARAGMHLRIAPSGASVSLDPHPSHLPHRPAVDVLFASAAVAGGPAALGVVLTGMGDDGLLGARAMVAAGGRVLSQSAESCVVYGMPRVIAEAGLSAGVVDLDMMPSAIAAAL